MQNDHLLGLNWNLYWIKHLKNSIEEGIISGLALPNLQISTSTPIVSIELYGSSNIQYVFYFFRDCNILFWLSPALIFMNLATARSAKRAREVGVRGSWAPLRFDLIYQFLMEAFLTSMISMILAYGITKLTPSFFNELAGKNISAHVFIFAQCPDCYAGTSRLLSECHRGSLSRFYLSAFQPVAVLKALWAQFKKSIFRNALGGISVYGIS